MKKRAMTSDEREIQAPVATWMAATRAGDLDTVLGLMAEDVVFLVHGREPMVGKAAYAAAARRRADEAGGLHAQRAAQGARAPADRARRQPAGAGVGSRPWTVPAMRSRPR